MYIIVFAFFFIKYFIDKKRKQEVTMKQNRSESFRHNFMKYGVFRSQARDCAGKTTAKKENDPRKRGELRKQWTEKKYMKA